MKRVLFITYIVLVQCQAAWSQIELDLRTESYNEDDGLSNNLVMDFAQDQNGFMWIATANGLNRFDGKTFAVFKKNYSDTNSLQHNIITDVAVDSKNNVWIGYGKGGISRYNQTTQLFTHFSPDSSKSDKLRSGSIDEMLIDNQDRIWIGVAKNGLTLFDPITNRFQWLGMLPFVSKERSIEGQLHYNRLSQMLWDEKGKIRMATGDGFYTYDTTSKNFEVFRFEQGVEDIFKWKRDVFNTICHFTENDFYLAGWGTGLNHYNLKTKKWKTYLLHPESPERGTSNIINSIIRKSDHELWIASNDTSLCVFNTNDETFYYLTQQALAKSNLPDKGLITFFTDSRGDLWIGKYSGINFLNQSEPEFTFIHHPVTYSENYTNYVVSYVFDDPVSGKTFISTSFADGLNVKTMDGKIKNHEINILPGEEPFQILNKIFNDSKNNLWVLSRDYLYLFDRKKDGLIKTIQPKSAAGIGGAAYFWNISEDKNGLIWIATYRHGIYVFDPAKKSFTQFLHQPGNKQSLLSNTITGMEWDNSGNLWIGYKHDGISRYNPGSNKFDHYVKDANTDEGLLDNDILSMHADKSGTLWVGSFTGLCSIETGKYPIKVTNFLKDQELLGITITHIETDYEGNVWFSNIKGLSVFNPVTKELKNYTKSNGLPVEYHEIYISKGQYPLMNLTAFAGYYQFKPGFSKIVSKPEKVHITSFVTGDKKILVEHEITKNGKVVLNATDNLLTMDFISINYKNPGSLSYSYRLSGLDNTWKTINNAAIASYSNLPGGDYVFEVKAKNPSGVWSEVTSVPIYIITPIYKANWFMILMAFAIATSILLIYRWRISNIEKTESLKTQFNKKIAETEMRALRAQMNPHFIFNCLNSINRYIVKNDRKTASLYLTKFAKLIRLILDNSENHQVSLSQELDALKLYIDIEALRFDHKFSYEISVDKNVNIDSLLIPPMIIQPFVENAIWHGLLHKESHGKMKLRFFLDDDILVCEVEDDGVGREKAMILKSKSATTRKSMGLKITSERLAILNEKANNQGGVYFEDLKDNDGVGSGTRVIIRVPVDADYFEILK